MPDPQTLPTLVAGACANDGRDKAAPPPMRIYRMWTDADGMSRLARCEVSGFALQSVGGGAAPQWMLNFAGDVEAVKFNVLPVGWVGEWHESPKPQWVVPLSGRWFLETQDGRRAEMGPGDIHWGEDRGTRAIAGHMGHRSGTLGDAPCVQMMVQFRQATLDALAIRVMEDR